MREFVLWTLQPLQLIAIQLGLTIPNAKMLTYDEASPLDGARCGHTRQRIINAESEFQAAEKMVQAAAMMSKEPIALQLRFLQTMREISSEHNNTSFLPIPIDVFTPFLKRLEGGGPKWTPAALADLKGAGARAGRSFRPPGFFLQISGNNCRSTGVIGGMTRKMTLDGFEQMLDFKRFQPLPHLGDLSPGGGEGRNLIAVAPRQRTDVTATACVAGSGPGAGEYPGFVNPGDAQG